MHVAASRLTTGEKGRPVSSDKDEVTSSILVSPTRTPASAGVLLFSCCGFRCVATETCSFWLLVCYVIFNKGIELVRTNGQSEGRV